MFLSPSVSPSSSVPAPASTSESARPRSSASVRSVVLRLVTACAVLVALTLPRAAEAQAAGPTRVAVIDTQRAVMQTEDGLRAQATLKKMFDSRQQELNKKQQDLAKQKEDIEKQAKSGSRDAVQKRAEEWQKAYMELQAVFVDYNKELEKKQKELTEPIFEKIMGLVKRLAAQDGFDVVLDKATTAYVKTELDLTDRAIQMYNSGK
jgi:outer membrane protein